VINAPRAKVRIPPNKPSKMEKMAAGNVLPEKPDVSPPMKTAMPPTALAMIPIQNKILIITGVIIRSKLKNRFIVKILLK
jgi:hypothetical protein